VTLGLILAGGQARRMGGGDKALLPLGGQTLLARVIERLGPQCSALALSANGDPGRFAEFALPVLSDERPDFSGPLAGLLAGLDYAQTTADIADVVTMAADTPFLPLDLVMRLRGARAAAGSEIAVARSGGREHHLAALWPVSIAGALRRALFDEGLRKVGVFASRYRLIHADWAIEPLDPFFNVNTPEDLLRAESLLQRG